MMTKMRMLRSDKVSDYSMALVVNASLGMSAGKVAAQAAHGAVKASLLAQERRPEVLSQWLSQGGRKICLRFTEESEVQALQRRAEKRRIQTVEVRDAGLTEVPTDSLTVVVLGPGSSSKIEQLTSGLRLY
jgi:PTH2 family peptidyl-tRNA hydrolase